jgi:hypothetical protein
MPDRELKTRSTDSPEDINFNLAARRNAGRARTVIMSIVLSSFACLLLINFVERDSVNDQAIRSRVNCLITQNLGVTLEKVANDVATSSSSEEVRGRWAGFAEEFAKTHPPLSSSCKDLFPKRSAVPFIGDDTPPVKDVALPKGITEGK